MSELHRLTDQVLRDLDAAIRGNPPLHLRDALRHHRLLDADGHPTDRARSVLAEARSAIQQRQIAALIDPLRPRSEPEEGDPTHG